MHADAAGTDGRPFLLGLGAGPRTSSPGPAWSNRGRFRRAGSRSWPAGRCCSAAPGRPAGSLAAGGAPAVRRPAGTYLPGRDGPEDARTRWRDRGRRARAVIPSGPGGGLGRIVRAAAAGAGAIPAKWTCRPASGFPSMTIPACPSPAGGEARLLGPSISATQLADAGLTPADFHIAAAALERRDAATARELITPQMLKLGIAGDAAAIIDRCRALVAAGATHLSFGPPLGPDPVAAVTKLGGAVLPALRDRPGKH